MDVISISQLKTNPAKALEAAMDAPLGVQKRNKLKAYLIGSELFEKLVSYIEDYIDSSAVETTDFSKGRDFEKVAKELGI
ncbi:MAG: type II toxin-antitoxin system Phd/YefM family antitoxin [Patescibacteria group bacterium]